MAALGASAYLLSGLIISVGSLLVDKMSAFIIIGVLFILIGLIKTARKPKKVSNRHIYNTQPATTETAKEARRCFVCSATNSAKANFCGHCGHKLS